MHIHLSCFIFSFLLSSNISWAALEYSKIEFPGCPENAFCQKSTGEIRTEWLNALDNFNRGKISEAKFNDDLQKKAGIPIANWSTEEGGKLTNILLWDSPCKQHKNEASRFYIGEFFRKNLKENELKEITSLYFARAVGLDANKKAFSIIIPRGDIPTFSQNNEYYFLREDDGKYFGLLVNKNGNIRVTKPTTLSQIPKDAVCLKEQVDLFNREAPSPSFYQSYYCKDIWDKTTSTYKTMLFGWSCS
jgi:hypothetical protein